MALNLDMTKAYQSIRTPGTIEQNVRRLVWRYGDKTVTWNVYKWVVMTFGDQLASLILELCLNRAAELGKTVDSEAALLLQLSRYVDDVLGGGDKAHVDRFQGNLLPDGTFDGTLPTILRKVGLSTKLMVRSGENDPYVLEKFDGKVRVSQKNHNLEF